MSDAPLPPTPARRIAVGPLLAAAAVVTFLGFLVFRHFLVVFTLAVSVALLLHPLQARLSRALRGRRTIAALLIVLLAVVTVMVPVLGSVALLGQQVRGLVEWAGPRLQAAALKQLWHETLPAQFPWLAEWIDFEEGTLPKFVSDGLGEAVSTVNRLAQRAVAGLTTAFLEALLFLVFLFFLLRDGSRLAEELRHLSPLSETSESQVFDHLARTVKGVLLSMVVVPLAQGVVALPGFVMFGLPSPLLWTAAVVLVSLVPAIGTPLVWLPAAVYLYRHGEAWQGMGLFVWGLVVISGVDNLVKPLVLRGSAQIHPLLGFLAILGGLLSFGPSGLLVGPVILSLALSALRIYRLEILPRLTPEGSGS